MAIPPPTSRVIKNPKTRFNWRVSDLVRRAKSRWLEMRAKITGQKFYCSALAGDSEYNITINSDLTVSCNCQDYDGSGHLGDLRKIPSRKFSSAPSQKNSTTIWKKEKFQS